MSNTTLDRILKQCRSFIADPDSNYMDDIFTQKLKAFSNPALTDKDQKKLCTYHHKLICEEVIPAYQELINGLEKLRGTGKSSRGLAFLRAVVNTIFICSEARPEPTSLSRESNSACPPSFFLIISRPVLFFRKILT